jgi:secreted Zn-dependent insulinase-like peptidase
LRAHAMISEHMEDIIGLVFKYILLLKENGIHEWIYDEVIAKNMAYAVCKSMFYG